MKNAVLFLDKPKHLSSQQAVSRIKRLFNTKKAGHTGTLDPLATGMLQICLNQATKFAQYFLNDDKKYLVTIELGKVTGTGDAEGEIISEKKIPILSQAQIENYLENFVGEQTQIPPMYSALKYQGRPLYELARQGIEIERQPRQVTIYHIQLLNYSLLHIQFEVHVSKGTYIRTLAMDIGEKIGCGAFVAELRRTAIGHFDADFMHTLEKIEQSDQRSEFLVPVDRILPAVWEGVVLDEASEFYLKRGQAISVKMRDSDHPVKLYNQKQEFVGLGELNLDHKIQPIRLIIP